jgi:hypothetical protein
MATWAAVTKLSPRPKWLLTRAGGAVPHPGFLLLGTPGNATGPVVILMLMQRPLRNSWPGRKLRGPDEFCWLQESDECG